MENTGFGGRVTHWSVLTAQELKVLVLFSKGLSGPEVGSNLNITRTTADKHKSNLMRKLGLSNVSKLTRYALSFGLLQPYDVSSPISSKSRVQPVITAPLRIQIFARDGALCVVCGSDSDLCVDHIIPVSAGGTNDPLNLHVLCRSCNSSKGNQPYQKWLEERVAQ